MMEVILTGPVYPVVTTLCVAEMVLAMLIRASILYTTADHQAEEKVAGILVERLRN